MKQKIFNIQKNMFTQISLGLSVLMLSACVTSSKYNKAVEAYEQKVKTQDETLKGKESAIQQKETEIQSLQEKLVSTTKDKGQLKSSLEEMKKALDEMKLRRAQEQKTIQEFKDLTARFKTLRDAGTLTVQMVEGKMVVSLGSDVLFPSGSALLSQEGLKTIKEIAKQLGEIQNKKFQIEGHTDNLPIKTAVFPSNWELASARSLSVLKTMVENGMDAHRLSAASYADQQPVVSNETQEGRAKNRRIEIVVVPDLSTLPGYDELQKLSK